MAGIHGELRSSTSQRVIDCGLFCFGVNMEYIDFLKSKTQAGCDSGFDPVFMPDVLFDFQKYMVEYAVKRGRAALFEDCGLGKTVQFFTWAENIVRKTNKPVLIITPLAVSIQVISEAEKFGFDVRR